jgi:hypothetical protein
MFTVLGKLSDIGGTFDQMAPLSRLQAKFSGETKIKFSSIDLSAATDRLPILIQNPLIRELMKGIVPNPKEFADCWQELLVGRPYQIVIQPRLRKLSEVPKTLPDAV